jgi:hypothetical protein
MKILGFLLGALVLLPIGVKYAAWGIGIPILALGLALILPERRDEPTVTIEDMAFVPEWLRIEAGDTVNWVWNDGDIAHRVAGDGFQSEVMSEGTFSYRFDEPGTFDYYCTLHPNMAGTIDVTG